MGRKRGQQHQQEQLTEPIRVQTTKAKNDPPHHPNAEPGFGFVELIPIIVTLGYIATCPFTKVEESFNMQATHDVLYLRNLTTFDHLTYPGVVPRSFLGPLCLAGVSAPLIKASEYYLQTPCDRLHALYITRGVLGLIHCFGLIWVGREASKLFGKACKTFFLLATCVQFHQLFYASRLLPNSFAMVLFLPALALLLRAEAQPVKQAAVSNAHTAFKILTSACLVFRADLLVLIAPLLLGYLVTQRVPFFATCLLGIRQGISTIIISTIVDSIFWGRLVWPEGEVLYFNTVLNKSSDWGVLPWDWYFKVALLKSLLAVYPLFPLAVWGVARLRVITISGIAFVALYSVLPHKELRFIFYMLPIVNVAVAALLSKVWYGATGWRRGLMLMGILGAGAACACVSVCLLYVSKENYPGGAALSALQAARPLGGAVHVDTGPSMEGITRFQKNYCGAWSYDKTPYRTNTATGKPFDFHITFEPGNYTSKGYRVIHNVSSFVAIDSERVRALDLWPPPLIFNTTAYLVEISSTASSHFQRIISGNELSP
eukprot:TRINITY_DN19673_c0_g1_i1.p1 TRINITY_DN19673_c0_g1~~TRINITY_DN19673_c0_g1_i1.p1  ORF type:complete len:562 (+),score=92.08 TRINITY_DN19673_c0_g1_i1:56-1687(+)